MRWIYCEPKNKNLKSKKGNKNKTIYYKTQNAIIRYVTFIYFHILNQINKIYGTTMISFFLEPLVKLIPLAFRTRQISLRVSCDKSTGKSYLHNLEFWAGLFQQGVEFHQRLSEFIISKPFYSLFFFPLGDSATVKKWCVADSNPSLNFRWALSCHWSPEAPIS